MIEQLNRYELIHPTSGKFSEKFHNCRGQIDAFLGENGNRYPFVIYSKNEEWNEMHYSREDMVIESDADRDYHALTYLNMTGATSTTTVDMAFDDQVIIDRAYGIYQEYCIKKDQISFKDFYDAYVSMNDALMILIR